MELDKAIKSRKSVREYTSKTPDWRTIIECIDSMRFAPMAGNVFSLKFILINDSKKIQKISEACQQDFISKAQYVLVLCSNKKITINEYGEKAEIYCKQQAGAAIQNFLLKITESGLSTCWVGHFVENQIKLELKIPEDVDVEALFPIGYEKGREIKKRKIDLDNCLYFNSYSNKKMQSPNRTD